MSGEPVPPESLVADTETLYRAVRNDPRFIAIDSDGNARISSMAFNDPSRRPSVDRAALCPGGPQETRDRFRPGSADRRGSTRTRSRQRDIKVDFRCRTSHGRELTGIGHGFSKENPGFLNKLSAFSIPG